MALADFLVTLVTLIAIYSLFGLGLNVKFGFTGLIDFGHVAYFMIGAYAAVWLTMPAGDSVTYDGLAGPALPELLGAVVPGGALLGWLLGVAGGMIVAALVSLLVGIPTLRLREDYLAITALGIGVILNRVINNEVWLFNGPFGVREIHQPLASSFPVGLGSFWANVVVLGGISALVLGYAVYRTGGIARRAGTRSSLLITGVVLLLAASAAGILVEGVVRYAAAVGFVASLYAGFRVIERADRPVAALSLASIELFVLWYFVGPLVRDGPAAVFLSVVWLFAPNAGAAGGLDYDRLVLLLSVGAVALAYWWIQRTVNSPYGRVLRAIREDEDVPEALGRRTYRYKIQALMFGSALAGAAGALWAVNIGFIAPSQFEAPITFFAFTAVIIGGTANNRGVILGTAVFWIINSGTRFLDDYFSAEYAVQFAALRMMLIGTILIVILYYRPEGILGEQEYDVRLPEDERRGLRSRLGALTDGGRPGGESNE